jgi:hypothetical protein
MAALRRDFGPVSIYGPITIDGGNRANIAFTGDHGILVNAPAGVFVTLRGLSINGLGTGLDAITLISGGRITVEDCSLNGFTEAGLWIGGLGGQNILVHNMTITGGD